MLRGNVTYSDWTWSKVPASSNADPTAASWAAASSEGDAVLQGSGTGSGSKGGVYINSKWSYSLNGLYQIAPDRPWGFNVALNLNGRQGYPIPYFRRVGLPTDQYVTGAFGQRAGHQPTGLVPVRQHQHRRRPHREGVHLQ